MTNAHAIEVTYLGATDTRGSRVKLYSHRFGDSVTIPYDYTFNNAHDIAENWLRDHYAGMVCGAETKNGHIIMIDTFKSLKDIQKIV